MSYIMDPSSRDWSKGSLRGSSAPFSPDTDGDPVELSVEDLELARKKKELKVIEEKIAHKKAVLALQKVKRGAKDMPETQAASTTVKGISKQTKINNTIFKTYNHVTDKSSRVCLPLKQRVLDILSKFRRTAVWCMRKPKKQNKMRALELMISAPLENEEAHPLGLRVKVLMNQRRSPNNKVVPNDKQHNPTIQRPVHSLRTQEKDIAATGFQRFLNVLNEGVDINKLSKIVNDENELLIVGEELPQVLPTLLEGHVDSSSRSKSSPVEEKVRLEDEQRYERMQTLLEIVGLDLGVEELGRLTDRTNDRLYGKMGDLKRKEFENENEKEKEKKESEPLFKHLSTSSLPSDSASPRPLLNQHSNMTVEYSSSSNKEWDKERHRDRSERDWHRHSGTRDKDREREEDIVREMERSERDGERDGHRDRDREDRAREGESSTRERCGQRCSSTRDKDRVRERDRSERNRKGDGHRHSSTRERDEDKPVVRETYRSERNRDKDGDRDPEKDWDGGRERDRDRSRRDGGRCRSGRDRDRDPEKDCDGGRERDRDRSGRDRDPEKGRDGGREKDRDRVRDRDKYRSERDRNQEIDKDIERWLQRTRDRDKSPWARDWDSESDWDSHSRTRDWDRARSERDMYEDESRENSIEHYSYYMDPIYPVSDPHAFMMANYSTNQYSQYMTYHSSPYTIAFPPGWGYPPGTMPAGAMPPGNMPPGTMPPGTMLPGIMPPEIMPAGAMLPSNKPLLPNLPGYPAYPSAPPYYSYGTAALNQTYSYTQPASNLQLTSTQPASNLQLSSTQPASNLQLSSTQPASNLQLSSTQPASNLQLSSTQPASNLQLSSTQPASNLQLSSTQPASNLQLSSTQPASNLQLSSTQPASNLQLSSSQPASNLQLSSTQPASNLQLSSTQPATSNLHLSSTQPASTAAVLPLLRNPPICQKKLAPWYKEHNRALRQVSRQMERKWRSTKLEVFRLAWEDSKAQYRKALNAARSAYFSNQIEENKNNPKCIFDTVEKLTEKQHSPSEDGLHFT
ncbi:uncharacterized protein [Salvelinus alpinus]|uniref:uncharacterized protein n=1 Tax=Salvelinus alpinus TaxID=8036 RepID=UPI0039FC15C3